MISRRVKLIAAAMATMVVIAMPILARALHKDLTPVDQRHVRTLGQTYDSNAVIGPDGKLIGAASDPGVRSQLQRDGLPN